MKPKKQPTACVGCRFAEWQTTNVGRLHPSGDGRCRHPVFTEPRVIPASAYFPAFSNGIPSGGHIERYQTRNARLASCPTREESVPLISPL